MRDKNLIAILTAFFFLLYFIPFFITKLISVGFILFFAPGYFTLRIYSNIKREENLLIAPPLSLGISGLIAVILAALSILNANTMLIVLGAYIAITYILSKGEDLGKLHLEKPSKLVTVVVAMSLVLISIWTYSELTATPRHEIDIAIESWPKNVTVGDNLSFIIYIKNWNYGGSKCNVTFSINNKTIAYKTFYLDDGEHIYLHFNTTAHSLGKNIAFFNLYVNGKLYTNVHIYFNVKSKNSYHFIG